MYNVIEIKAICLYCGAANLSSGLECRKCGAPLSEQPKPKEVQVYYGPDRGGVEYKDEVSALEEKIGLSGSANWKKQVIDFSLSHLVGDETYFEFPQIGIVTQIKICFNYEAIADDWKIRIETGPGLILIDRGNAPGYIDTIRHIIDTEGQCNTRLRLTHNVPAFGRPRKIEVTRWVPTASHH